jgi:hypothetical protein
MEENIMLRHRDNHRTVSCVYHHWIHRIVNKGEANNYIILEYPDLVQLIIIHPGGKREKDKIIERKIAMLEIEKFPNTFDVIEIDVKKQIQIDINRSNTIGKKHNNKKHKIISRKFLYFISFILLLPLFSKNARVAIKKYIDINTNVIQAIAVTGMFILTAIMIFIMIN